MIYQTLLILLLAASAVKGQTTVKTGPVTTNDYVSFRLRSSANVDPQTMPVRLRVDTPDNNATFTTLLPPRTCDRIGNSSNYECQAHIPIEIVNRLNVPGSHLLYSFTFDGNTGESIASDPWSLVTKP